MDRWAGGTAPDAGDLRYAAIGGGRDPPSGLPRVLPNSCPAVRPLDEGAELNPLEGCEGHVRRLALSSRWALQSMCKVVHKLRDARVRKFFALAAAEYLPTERRLYVAKADGGRGDVCKLCWRFRESLRHVYVCDCPALRAGRRALVHRCVDMLRAAGTPVVSGGRAPGPRVAGADGQAVWIPVWFDLEGEHWMRVWVPYGTSPRLMTRDRYGDVLGLIPVGLDELLDRVWSSGQWRRRPLGDTQQLLGEVRLELLFGAHAVWRQRCRLVNEWFLAPSSRPYRTARILV